MCAKRSAGEGSIHQLPSGSWCAQVMDGYNDNGTRHIRTFTGPSRREVLDKVIQYRENKGSQCSQAAEASRQILFSTWADQWYAAYGNQVEASTYSSYHYTLALLEKYFAGKTLGSIKSMEINQFINWMVSQEYSASQISKCRAMMIQIMDAAEAQDLVTKNYARRAFRNSPRMKNQTAVRSKDAFTPEEFNLLMEYLTQDLLGNSIRLLLVTGMRVQELLALTPQDIAKDGSYITIHRAIKTVDGQPQLGPPKSRRSNRKVPIAAKYRPLAVWVRNNGGQAFIWCSSRENLLYSIGTFRRQYYRALAEIPGVRKLSPHSCRHTFVTLMQSKGTPLVTIAALTGHSDIQTTENYLHLSEETLQNAVQSLEMI